MKKYRAAFLAVVLIVMFLSGCSGGDSSSPSPPSSSKAITAFSFASPTAIGMIGQSAGTVLVNVPAGTDVTALVATFSTTGSTVKVDSAVQMSGVTPNDFTSPVIYTVIAADGSFQTYLVTVRAGALPPQWARTVTAGTSDSWFNSVSVASDGSVYAAGGLYGTGTYDFGNSVTAAGVINGGYNIVLVKYNSSGVAEWARTVTTGNNFSSFQSVAVASDGSVYAAGDISGTGTFDFGNSITATGTSGGDNNIVLVKYTSSGVAQWARTVTAGSRDSRFFSVSAASDGSVYAAGYIDGNGTLDFGNSVTAAGTYGSYNIVLVKYSSSGVAQWARTVTAGNSYSMFYSIVVASDSSVYAAGYISGTGTYDFGNSVTAAGTNSGSNIVLVKYDSAGVAQWARTVTAGNSFSAFYSIFVVSDSSVYAAGYISGTGTYDFGNSVTAAGTDGNNIILVKYTSAGMAQWARTVTAGSSESMFSSVSVASDGSVYAVGRIQGTYIYDFGNSVTATGTSSDNNLVLVKYTSTGVAQWAQTVTAEGGYSRFTSVFAASDGSVYAAGTIHDTATYDFGNSVTAAGTGIGNVVLVKYY